MTALLIPDNYRPRADLLAGKSILVTGAGDGIGRAAALSYASHGATVLLLGRTESKLEAVYDEIEAAGGAKPGNDPVDTLVDGKIGTDMGPLFANGVVTGMYKLDLAKVTPIAQVNTYSRGGERGRQNFVLYGSAAATDPGWNVADAKLFTPVGSVDARQDAEWKATSIRVSDGKPLGSYRWLVWAVFPINDSENTVYQELQVIPAHER